MKSTFLTHYPFNNTTQSVLFKDLVHTTLSTSVTARQAIYVQHNNEVQSCNHCCNGKQRVFRYSEYAFVAFGIQHAMHKHYIVVCGLYCSTIFVHIISLTTGLSKKKNEAEMCFHFLYYFCMKHFSF